MSSNSIPPPLRDLLAKLEYFAMIERGKKPCLNDMTFVDATSWFGSYKRSVGGEGRKNMIIQVNAIIDRAIAAIDEYGETIFISLIINALARARHGLSNLAQTYSHRPDTVAQLQVCLANIQLQLDKNKQYLQETPQHYPINSPEKYSRLDQYFSASPPRNTPYKNYPVYPVPASSPQTSYSSSHPSSPPHLSVVAQLAQGKNAPLPPAAFPSSSPVPIAKVPPATPTTPAAPPALPGKAVPRITTLPTTLPTKFSSSDDSSED